MLAFDKYISHMPVKIEHPYVKYRNPVYLVSSKKTGREIIDSSATIYELLETSNLINHLRLGSKTGKPVRLNAWTEYGLDFRINVNFISKIRRKENSLRLYQSSLRYSEEAITID